MTDKHRSRPPSNKAVERGRFTDGHTTFRVRASSAVAPDSFQVSVDGSASDVVLIVSGLVSGDLRATWGEGWRAFAPDWKVWVEDTAFKVFYNGHRIGERNDGPGEARHCNG